MSVLAATNGKAYFVLKAGNHQIIGQSKMYETERYVTATLRQSNNMAPVQQLRFNRIIV